MDKLATDARSKNMRAIKSHHSKPELIVRRLVHSLGYRYRLHGQKLPGKPDLVFSSRRKVIFVHGCFWHQHDCSRCQDSRIPRSNVEYWEYKLSRNTARDAQALIALRQLGWQFLILWECETKDTNNLKDKIIDFLA